MPASIPTSDAASRLPLMILSVNSQARSERGRALLSEVLDGLVVQPLVEVQTLEQCMTTRDPAPPPRLNLSVEERRTIIHDGLDRHYRDLLDQPIPVLGNKSPRAAVKTAKGRARVVDWLKTLENHTVKFAGSNDEGATYNFNWLWTIASKSFRRSSVIFVFLVHLANSSL
jgi:hypothetical protein